MMEYSNKLNLIEFFETLNEEVYCIIKLDKNFPNYCEYSDIDIFCYSIEQMSNKIFQIGNKYVNQGFEIKVTEVAGENQVHIDFYFEGKLDFRFDLYQTIPEYKKIKIKESFFVSVLENRKKTEKNLNDITFYIYEPSNIDDLILRYIEFIEYYDIRADKIKHADYINEMADNLNKKLLFDKLHYYTEIPQALCSGEEINDIKFPSDFEDNINTFKEIFKMHFTKLKRKPFKYLYYAPQGKLDSI